MQLVIGSQIKLFEKILKSKFNFEDDVDMSKPTLFWGVYGFSDLDIVRKHTGVRIIVFNGTDSTHQKILRLLRTLPETQGIIYISGSDWVACDLDKASIKHTKIPLLMSKI